MTVKDRLRQRCGSFLVAFAVAGGAAAGLRSIRAAGCFAAGPTFVTPNAPESIAIGDLNGDGNLAAVALLVLRFRS